MQKLIVCMFLDGERKEIDQSVGTSNLYAVQQHH